MVRAVVQTSDASILIVGYGTASPYHRAYTISGTSYT
jgi:hypothetical protein